VKRLVIIITLKILLTGLVLFGLGDTGIYVADTSIPDNEVASSEANDASASGVITITMYAVADE